MSKIIFCITLLFCISCVQMNNQESGSQPDNNTTSTTQSRKENRRKIFLPNTIHDFTKRVSISIPEEKINNPNLRHVVIENEKGTFRMIIDREDLLLKNDYSIPISKLGEKIEPQYVID